VDTVLLAVTVVSLAAAFVSFMSVRKLKQADQLRSDARVAALAAAAENITAPAVDPIIASSPDVKPVQPLRPPPAERVARAERPAASRSGEWSAESGEWRWNPEPQPLGDSAFQFESEPVIERSPKPAVRTVDSEATAAASSDMFGTVRREQPSSPRFAFAAALALIVALSGAVVVFTTSSRDKAAAPQSRATHTSALELVALGHSRDSSTLTINGVVRNPANGPKLEGLTAVVSLIDEHGGLISTKDVPLDYRALGPGEEAPFKMSVPDQGSIARYRVSFRAGTDVVPHVDRRTDTKLASAL
jgi:hypothetical protein